MNKDDMDRLTNRTVMAIVGGLGFGAALAIYRGSPVVRMSVLVGGSWFVAGSVLFTLEALAGVSARYLLASTTTIKEDAPTPTYERHLYATHAFGGMAGGALIGKVFHNRVLPGMCLFTPVMLCFAFAEKQFVAARDKRTKELMTPPP